MIQPVAFFVDDLQNFAVVRRQLIVLNEKTGHTGLDGSKWSTKIVGDGIEQRGFQALALAFGFRLAKLLDGAGALDRDPHPRAHGFERLPRKLRSSNAQPPDLTQSE